MDQWWSSGQVWGSPCTGSLLGTSFCVVIRGFSSKLSVLENNTRLSRLGPRENITLWRRAKANAVYPLRAVKCLFPTSASFFQNVCLSEVTGSFLHGNNSKAQCACQSEKGFGTKSERYPGCRAIARDCPRPCASWKQTYCVLFDRQMDSRGGL